MTDVLIRRDLDTGGHELKTMWRQRQNYMPRREASEWSYPYWHLSIELSSLQNCKKINFCCLHSQSVVFCYSKPGKLMQLPLYIILTVAFLHQNYVYWDFPGGPVIKSLCLQRRGPKFNPWSVNYILQAATKSPHLAITIQLSAMKIPQGAIKTRHRQKKKKRLKRMFTMFKSFCHVQWWTKP